MGTHFSGRERMVDIAALRKEDIGRWVLYTSYIGWTEKGRIKSWNDKYIFVVYKCGGEWDRFKDFTGQATDPQDLRFTTLEEVI